MTFRRTFVAGLAAILPILVTLFLLYTFFQYVDALTEPITARLLDYVGAREFSRPVPTLIWIAGVISYLAFMTVLIYLIGRLVASYIGGLIFQGFEYLVLKFPVVKAIYPYAKQVTDYIFSDKTTKFRQVVAVEYPRKGIYSIGFLTGDGLAKIQEAAGRKFVNVFVPSSPTPFTGYVIFVAEDELIHLSISVEQALRLTISGGVIMPPVTAGAGGAATLPSPIQEAAHAAAEDD